MLNTGGSNGGSSSALFLGSASQSTAATSPSGTVYQIDQGTGKIVYRTATGTIVTWNSGITALQSPANIAVDDVSEDIVIAHKSSNIVGISVGNVSSGSQLCYFEPAGVTFISSVAAKGGYITAVAPNENLVIFASLTGCSGNKAIPYNTVSAPGQPWAAAMATNGTELDAYVVSRDKASANGLPMLSQINVITGVTEKTVELSGALPVTTCRDTAATAYQCIYQVQAFSLSPIVAVLTMSNSNDGMVRVVNTNTSGANMSVKYAVSVPYLPIGIAVQESATSSTVWVNYYRGNGTTTTDIGAIDPTLATTNYTADIGTCAAGLVGGFVADANGVHCAGGSTIAPPLVLQP